MYCILLLNSKCNFRGKSIHAELIWFLLHCKDWLVCVETLKGWRMSAKSGEGILFIVPTGSYGNKAET